MDIWSIEDILYLIYSSLIVIIIYLFSYFGFTIIRNKHIIFIQFLAAVWVPVICFSPIINGVIPSCSGPDLLTYGFALMGLPVTFTATGIYKVLTYFNKTRSYAKKSFIEVLLISFMPTFLFISYEAYFCRNFLELESTFFIFIVVLDKLILLKCKYYLVQTIVKFVIVFALIHEYSYNMSGDTIILITDCMVGYVLLQATCKYELKQSFDPSDEDKDIF